MARTSIADVVLIAGVGAFGAYITNFMGFRDWFNSQTGIIPTPTPVEAPGGGGTTKTVSTPASVPLGKIFTYKGQKCWRNYRCGGAQVSVCGKTSVSDDVIYKSWVCSYACTKPSYCSPKPVAKPLTPGQKCIQLDASCRSHPNPCLCRCGNYCKKLGRYPILKADYSCSCTPKKSAFAQSYYTTPEGGFYDAELERVPTIV